MCYAAGTLYYCYKGQQEVYKHDPLYDFQYLSKLQIYLSIFPHH